MCSYLYQLDEVLRQFVISQGLLQTANCKRSHHGVWVVAVQQLHGLLWLD